MSATDSGRVYSMNDVCPKCGTGRLAMSTAPENAGVLFCLAAPGKRGCGFVTWRANRYQQALVQSKVRP